MGPHDYPPLPLFEWVPEWTLRERENGDREWMREKGIEREV